MELLSHIEFLISAGVLIFSIYLLIYYAPAYRTKFRAASVGIPLTLSEAKVLNIVKLNSLEFFTAAQEIISISDIAMADLVVHQLTGGHLANIKIGVMEMKQKNRPVDFKVLAALDIAGKNLKEEIAKAEANNWEFRLGEP